MSGLPRRVSWAQTTAPGWDVANPGVSHVDMTSDGADGRLPVTGQLDLYVAYERVLAGRPLHRVEACGLRKRDPAANAQVRAHDGLLVADA